MKKLTMLFAFLFYVFSLFLFLFSLDSKGQTMQRSPQKLVVSSTFLPVADTCWVFLPKNYVATQTFPLVYLLHGWSGNYKQWNNITSLQTFADQYQCLIVCPDGLYDSWYLDSPQQQFAQFFFKDLHPTLLKKYAIKQQNIFISGVSMGGYGAFSLFLQQPEIFAGVAATSALFDLTLFENSFGLPKILQKIPKTVQKELSIHQQIQKKAIRQPIYFDCGTEDAFFADNLQFDSLCKTLNLSATFVKAAGNHNKKYWQQMIKGHFEFFKQNSKK